MGNKRGIQFAGSKESEFEEEGHEDEDEEDDLDEDYGLSPGKMSRQEIPVDFGELVPLSQEEWEKVCEERDSQDEEEGEGTNFAELGGVKGKRNKTVKCTNAS